MKKLLLQYVQYNCWANERIAEKLLSIDKVWFDKEIKSSFSSLRKTIFHIWDAELIWLNRIQGKSMDYWPSKTNLPGNDYNDTAIDKFPEVSEDFVKFVEKQEEDFFNSLCHYRTTEGKEQSQVVSGITMHCMNHSTFHRGQFIMMLKSLDIDKLPSTDLITYLRA